MRIISTIVCVVILLTQFACAPKKKSGTIPPKKKPYAGKTTKVKPVTIDSLNNDIANFVSGIVPGKFLKLRAELPWWKTYSASIDKEWDIVRENKVRPIRSWADSLQISKDMNGQTLFYPFSGPDFLYANLFFPTVKNYVLIALEPLGTLHNVTMEENEYSEHYLQQIQKSLFFSTHDGFFRTKSMEKELNQIDLNGTVHLLLFYIKRCGYQITAVTPIELDTAGNVLPFDASNLGTVTSVKIDFCDSTKRDTKTLYYFSYDLSDENLQKHPRVLRFAEQMGTQSTLLKAASYLLHRPEFTIMRQYVLNNSQLILQDDSGVPYKRFDRSGWTVELFGNYSRTIDLFTHKYQADLKAAYDARKQKHLLPFRIGYNLVHSEVNMMLARRIH
ncbi:MAG: hypothetical protein NTV54_09010 [Ignavibacteriales bacterium]|nr:hypothetical protein [Ignavibacteriales bacterium]